MMNEILSILQNQHSLGIEKFKEMKTPVLTNWCMTAVRDFPRAETKRICRYCEWSVRTTLQELQKAQTLITPSLKQKKKSP